MKHRRHFYFLSALVLTVMSGLLLDGPLYVLTIFLLQMILACTITVIRHRNIDQWFYDHVESTYFLVSIYVGICLLYISMVPFFINTWLSNMQLILFFMLPCSVLASVVTWYAARHMHHKKIGKQDVVGMVQVSFLSLLFILALNMVLLDRMIIEPYPFTDGFEDSALYLNQEGLQDLVFIQDVTEVFEQERASLELLEVDKAAYDPLCVFHDCLMARINAYKLYSKIDGLNFFVQDAVSTVRTVNSYINETNLSTVHSKTVNEYQDLYKSSSTSWWRETFNMYDEANSFVLRGYAKLLENSQYGSYLFQVRWYDDVYEYKKMMQLNVNESQLSQTYRYAFLSGDFY